MGALKRGIGAALLVGFVGAAGCAPEVDQVFGLNPAAGGAGGAGQGGAGQGGEGGTGPCMTPAHCPVPVSQCERAVCTDGVCGIEPTPAGAPSRDQLPGDCRIVVCDAEGNLVLQSDDTDVPNDTLDCTLESCVDGEFVVQPAPAGTPCDDGGGVTCDDEGQCGGGICGDGLLGVGEQCDDQNDDNTDACLDTCVFASCGDGFVRAGTEACDDGNQSDTDCCSTACEPTGLCPAEQEPNDTCPPGGTPLAPAPQVVVLGSIQPASDEDVVAFTLQYTSDVRIETFSGSGVGTCGGGTDTEVTLLGEDCATEIAGDDNGGQGNCSLLDPASTPAMVGLQAGTYHVRARGTGADEIPAYALAITVVSACGNGVREGLEHCDDGNEVDGDGCSAQCRAEDGVVCTNEPPPSVCAPAESQCNDGVDNDGDLAIDDADTDCALGVAMNPCAAGESLHVYQSSDVPESVLDQSTATSEILVAQEGTVTRAVVQLWITHTYDGDLDLFLVSPAMTQIDLSSDNGGQGNGYLGTRFDDTCATLITAGMPPYAGCFRPEQSLSAVNGQGPMGTWTLRVRDGASGDQGALTAWSLGLCVAP
ncbi:DUF4215 domain-containing protein [Chondromyces apiculatus]|nr:DUF4215 domain-containing protein [Chondromyces apiculatus]